MKIKTFLSSLACALLLAGSFTGCTTAASNTTTTGTNAVPVSPINPASIAQTAAITQMAAELGVYAALQNEPSSRPYFVLAVQVLTTAVKGGTNDPTALMAAISGLQINGVQNPNVVLGIKSALVVYQYLAANAVAQKIDANVYASTVLNALIAGINSGLGTPAATARKFALPPPRQ